MDKHRIVYLYQRWKTQEITAAEQQEFAWLMKDEKCADVLKNYWETAWHSDAEQAHSSVNNKQLNQEIQESIYQTIIQFPQNEVQPEDLGANSPAMSESRTKSINKRLWIRRISIAAGLLLALGFIGYFTLNSLDSSRETEERMVADIEPGKTRAELTLADGSTFQLSDGEDVELGSFDGINLHKTRDGELVYQVEEFDSAVAAAGATATHKKQVEPTFHVVSTQAGGWFQINLPDGSKVWLNAASSLKYSVPFSTRDRVVELTGEGYFEISSNPDKPFVVKTREQSIRVLGTHFNVNSYENEPSIKTTLVEGSVEITQLSTQKKKMLKPGDQSIVSNTAFQILPVRVEHVIDWKNNNFNFDHEELESIMRKLARWYNIDIEYEGNYEPYRFSGSVSRSKNLSEVMRLFEMTGQLTYRIENPIHGREERRVVIMM